MHWNCSEGTLGPQVMSFVERFIILFPYLGESTVRDFTVVYCTYNSVTVTYVQYNMCEQLCAYFIRLA